MVRPLPIIFIQTEYYQALGFGPGTIKDYGCYLTSLATLAKACGKTITPVMLNTLLLQKNLFSGMLLASDTVLTQIFPDILYQETLHYETIPADLEQLRSLMSDPTLWVILEIDLGNSNTHFVLCAGVNGVISIADPETGACIDFASKYGDPAKNILKFVVYKGTPATVDSQVVQGLQSQLDQAKQVEDSRQETITTLQAQLQAQSVQNQGLLEQTSQLNQKLADVAKENTNYETTITELKTEMAELSTENASLADMVRKEADKNSTSIKEGVKASSTLKDLTNYIQGFIGYFKLKGMNEKQFIEYLCDEVIKMEKLRTQTQNIQPQVSTNAVQVSPTVSMSIKGVEIKKKVPFWLSFLQMVGIAQR